MKRMIGVLMVGICAMSAVAPAAAVVPLKGEVTVSAAASLTDSFVALAKAFRAANPKVKVRLNFGSTSTLVAQIQVGAPSDVIAAADMSSVERLVASGNVVAGPRVFARNNMAIAVKPGNPEKVKSIKDLARLKTIAMCGKAAPCGVYASSVLSRAGVVVKESNITRGVDAKATLGAVVTGDADAAIVYKTDVIAAGKSIQAVDISTSSNVKAAYGIASIRGSKNGSLAKAFVDFVLSEQGWRILKGFGFQKP
jgi:molybdate transport system substrate-binding protein